MANKKKSSSRCLSGERPGQWPPRQGIRKTPNQKIVESPFYSGESRGERKKKKKKTAIKTLVPNLEKEGEENQSVWKPRSTDKTETTPGSRARKKQKARKSSSMPSEKRGKGQRTRNNWSLNSQKIKNQRNLEACRDQGRKK